MAQSMAIRVCVCACVRAGGGTKLPQGLLVLQSWQDVTTSLLEELAAQHKLSLAFIVTLLSLSKRQTFPKLTHDFRKISPLIFRLEGNILALYFPLHRDIL